jgi:hypothetical protein
MRLAETTLRKLEQTIKQDEKRNLDWEDLGILLCEKYGYEYKMENPKLLPVVIMIGEHAIDNLLYDERNASDALRHGEPYRVQTPMTLLPKDEIINRYDLGYSENVAMVNNKKLLQIVLKEGIKI